MKEIGGITFEELITNALVVVRWSTGYRQVMTIKEYLTTQFDEDDWDYIKDVGDAAQQPDVVKAFFEEAKKIETEHGWMTYEEMFEKFGK